MMHFSTSDENFRKKLPYVCKVKLKFFNSESLEFLKLIHPLISDLTEEKPMIYGSFRK